MVAIRVTHKQGVKLIRPRNTSARNMAEARSIAEKNNWDGEMEHNGHVLPLRIKR